MPRHESNSLLKVIRSTNNYLIASILLFFLLTLSSISVVLYQSHKTVCELFDSKIETAGSSIARELALGEEKIAFSLFEKIKSSLKKASPDVNVQILVGGEAKGESCSAEIFRSLISYQLSFSGEDVGSIVGEVKSFKRNELIFFVIAVFVLITSLLSLIKKRLIDNIKNQIVNPIEKLCGQELVLEDDLPSEVKVIASKLSKMKQSIALAESARIELLQAEKISNVATQVAHDIRSPLEMLKGLKDELGLLPESSRKRIQLGINRIEEVTFNLLKKHKVSNTNFQNVFSEDLFSLLTSIITEKTIEFRERKGILIKSELAWISDGFFSKIDRPSLKSIISNLVNNSVEAIISGQGFIQLQLSCTDSSNIITIKDNGPGIPENIAKKLFTKGLTTKKDGNGLGLYNAKQDIEAVGGTLTFTTEIGKGTTFTIALPKSEAPPTFIESIKAYKYDKIIVLDDDPAFHEVWSKKFEGLESKIEHIFTVKEMLSKYEELNSKTLLLSDFELMDKDLDGIDTILKLNHAFHSILVTARSEEMAINERCLEHGIKILPKSLVNYIQVETKAEDVILIDDDKLMHISWSSYCLKNKIPFKGFKSVEDFMKDSDVINKEARIYIDSNLGNGIKGELESEKIFLLGFKNLFLATGYEPEDIKAPSWIKKVYSKSPENIS